MKIPSHVKYQTPSQKLQEQNHFQPLLQRVASLLFKLK